MKHMDPNLEKYLSEVHFESRNEEHKFHNLLFISIFVETFVLQLQKVYGVSLQDNFIDLKGDYARWVPNLAAFEEASQKFFQRAVNEPSFSAEVNGKLFVAIKEVNRFSRDLLSTDFSTKTNKEIIDLCEKYVQLEKEMIGWGMFPVIMEIEHNLYTDFLTQLVDKKNKKLNAGVSVAELVAVLSTFQGETEAKREQFELLKLALQVKNTSALPGFNPQLKSHAVEFGWLTYGYGGPAWGEKEFTESLVALLNNENVAEKLKEFENSEAELATKVTFYENKLQLTPGEKEYFAIARDFMKGKALRKEAMSLAAYASEPLHREIAKRLNLSFLQARLMVLSELKVALEGGMVVDEKELNLRKKYVVFGVFRNGKDTLVLTGKGAEFLGNLIRVEKVASDLSMLSGSCACSGKATGIVKIINHPSDMAKMQKGDILVSYATTPDIVPAMKIASAIVADLGGLTSHAAIVSRELGVPCVIGTKIATKWLKDGDKVEVDASKGIVRKL